MIKKLMSAALVLAVTCISVSAEEPAAPAAVRPAVLKQAAGEAVPGNIAVREGISPVNYQVYTPATCPHCGRVHSVTPQRASQPQQPTMFGRIMELERRKNRWLMGLFRR